MEIRPVDATLLPDVADLFASSSVTRGCRCMWFLLSSKDAESGWSGENKARFERMVTDAGEPAGVLAYDDGEPVGWCAAGPRSRYRRVLRSPLMKGHDPAEDDHVWFVPCFFVRSGHRRAGLTAPLLTAVVELARDHGATAIEAFPLAGPGPHRDDRYLGTEGLFEQAGFHPTARPSARRVVMRRALVV